MWCGVVCVCVCVGGVCVCVCVWEGVGCVCVCGWPQSPLSDPVIESVVDGKGDSFITGVKPFY